MPKFCVQEISQYRTELMGVATLLVIMGHSAANGVVMPGWMESLCGLASVGVDIFLLVSGLGLWYSLGSAEETHWGGVIDWYRRRYKRILVPYLLIEGFSNILAITRGGSVLTALLNISTVNYWLNHQGAWYIAMLIPLYAITPAYDMFLKKVRQPVLFTFGLVIAIVGLSSVYVPIADVAITNIQENIRHVAVHLPPFFIGFMLAPMAKEQKNVSLFWMMIVPLLITVTMKFLHFGYWPGFLVFIFVPILCWVIKHGGKMINSILEL